MTSDRAEGKLAGTALTPAQRGGVSGGFFWRARLLGRIQGRGSNFPKWDRVKGIIFFLWQVRKLSGNR